jgi:hypothetical protein
MAEHARLQLVAKGRAVPLSAPRGIPVLATPVESVDNPETEKVAMLSNS